MSDANFAFCYGSGTKSIAEMLSTEVHPVPTEAAKQLIVDYYAVFPELASWISEKEDTRAIFKKQAEQHEEGDE